LPLLPLDKSTRRAIWLAQEQTIELMTLMQAFADGRVPLLAGNFYMVT
jgi:hypothetical protein